MKVFFDKNTFCSKLLADVLKDASVFVWCTKMLEKGFAGWPLWEGPDSAFCQTQPVPAGSNGPTAGNSRACQMIWWCLCEKVVKKCRKHSAAILRDRSYKNVRGKTLQTPRSENKEDKICCRCWSKNSPAVPRLQWCRLFPCSLWRVQTREGILEL